MPIERSGGGGGTTSPLTTKGDVYGFSSTNARIPVGSDHQVLTAASGQTLGVDWEYPPGFEIGYDQITANVTVTSTAEASGTTVIACAAHTFDGAPVIATFYSPVVSVNTTAGAFVAVCLFEGATQLGEFGTCEQPANLATMQQSMTGMFRFTPTAGSHTYTVTAFKNNGGATCVVQAGAGGTGANMPAFIRFTKV